MKLWIVSIRVFGIVEGYSRIPSGRLSLDTGGSALSVAAFWEENLSWLKFTRRHGRREAVRSAIMRKVANGCAA